MTSIFFPPSRYNLKRRITSLPPLSSEVFAEKVLHIQATNRIAQERATFQKECKTCAKTYFSENAYNNHLGSQKHKQNVSAEKLGIRLRKGGVPVGDKDEMESVISSTFSLGTAEGEESKTSSPLVGVMDQVKEEGEAVKQVEKEFVEMVKGMKVREAEELQRLHGRKSKMDDPVPAEERKEEEGPAPLSLEECLFCTYTSPTLTLNISHMHKAHGLFIPEKKYLMDLPGLIRYLGEKVAILHECLYCGKVKGGMEGVRTHMRDVGHCRIAFDTVDEQVEVGEFYDFRSTYEDVEGSDFEGKEEPPTRYHRRRSSGIKSNRRATGGFKTEAGVHAGDDDEAWETDSSASSLDSTELCAVPLDHHHSGCSSLDGQDYHHHHHHRYKPHHHHHHHHHISTVYHTEYELHLPSGRMAGHRSLARYYRQNLSHPLNGRLTRQKSRRPLQDIATEYGGQGDEEDGGFAGDNNTSQSAPSRELTRRERRDLFFGRMTEEERAIVLGAEGARRAERGLSGTARGELGMIGVSADKRRFVREEERRARRDEQRKILRITARVQRQQNSQKYFRDPLLQ